MMCRLMRLFLPLYVGGDLSGGLDKWVSGHVGRCEHCATDLEQMNAARDRVRILADRDVSTLPVDFAIQVREQIEQGAGGVQPNRQRWVWAAAAALFLAGFGLFAGFEESSEVVEVTIPAPEALPAMAKTQEEFTAGDLAAMMSLLHPNRELTDAELDRKYPVVESMNFPNGTQMVYHTDDPNTKIVWVVAQEGVHVQ